MPSSKKLILDARLHHVHPDRVEALAERVRLAADPNVLPRPLAEYSKAATEGTLFVVEVDGEVQAVSGIFDSGDVAYAECGGTLVLPGYRGFGLQEVLLLVRLASAVIQLPGMKLVTGVKPTNVHSRQNTDRAGFEPWPEPAAALLEWCASCSEKPRLPPGRKCCCDFYLLPKAKHAAGVKRLLDLPELLTRNRKEDGAVMQLRLDVRVVTDEAYRAALNDFVRDTRTTP